MNTQQMALFIAAGIAVWFYMDAKKNNYSIPETIGCSLAVFIHFSVFLQFALQLPLAIVPAGIGLWVYIDAKKHGYSLSTSIGWMLGVSWLLIVFLPFYLIIKSKRAKRPVISTTCEYCSKNYFGNPNYCPHCGHLVRRA